MNLNDIGSSSKFKTLTDKITSIGLNWHSETIVENSKNNKKFITKTIRDIPVFEGKKSEAAIVISAGPSLYKNNIIERIKNSGFEGTIIAVDGSYVRCIKAGLDPDYVLTLDPHPTRIVRWFGDPDFEKNLKGDDYFSRQDLDIEFRNNSIEENLKNISLVNKNGKQKKIIICSSAPKNVVDRVKDVGFDAYWWAPLVDDPEKPKSLTKKMVEETKLPAMNTGGTVGTAAWVFALTQLKIPKIAVVGMDLGYYSADTSLLQTQTYECLVEEVDEQDMHEYFPEFVYPETGERFYTDPTYYWYRQNMLDLVSSSGSMVYNCTGGGTLIGPGIQCLEIENFCNLVNLKEI
ncbi:DUF115 domain-containing protein [Candidatus Thioglobus sp.]|nr:DUF115 domain-containing protein [Candidatus Thioglobus sp.]